MHTYKYTHLHTVTMMTVLMGTGVSALSSLMDPVSQALGIIGGFAIKAAAAISKVVSPVVARFKTAFAPMLKRLYPDRIMGMFGGGANGQQSAAL